MPQMSPMFWLFMMLCFGLVSFLMTCNLYFNHFFKKSGISHIKVMKELDLKF